MFVFVLFVFLNAPQSLAGRHPHHCAFAAAVWLHFVAGVHWRQPVCRMFRHGANYQPDNLTLLLPSVFVQVHRPLCRQ